MRLFADTNIVAQAVRALRSDGHDVVYSGDWPVDPGDAALVRLAFDDERVLVTKDHDIGGLVFLGGADHAGVLLIDDLGSPGAETALLRSSLIAAEQPLTDRKFVRAGVSGVRIASA